MRPPARPPAPVPLATYPECRWQGRPVGPLRLACTSARVVAPRGVTAAHCAACPYRGHPEPAPGDPAARPTGTANRAARLAPGTYEEPVGDHWVRTRHCAQRNCWDWAALAPDKSVLAADSEPTQPAARAAALAALPDAPAARPAAAPIGPPPAPAPLPPGARRHLLYHLLPVAGNGTWQRNLDQLKWRLGLFNGRKVVAVATGGVRDHVTGRGTFALDPPEAVAEYLAGAGCEIITVPNDVRLREVASWGLLWGRVEEFAGTDDVVFYAQGKGVTQPWNPGVTVHPWTRMLYTSLLDFWPVVEDVLGQFPLAGSFKKVGHGFQGSRSTWHYSGSFFWIRAREAFAHGRVRAIDRQWWGNEAWPGLHWPAGEAGVVFKEGVVPHLDLYSPPFVWGQVVPEFRAWCAANAGRRTDWAKIGVSP